MKIIITLNMAYISIKMLNNNNNVVLTFKMFFTVLLLVCVLNRKIVFK